jgi:hypothetical protein
MRSGRVLLEGEDHVESVWTGDDRGKPSGEQVFLLAREKP